MVCAYATVRARVVLHVVRAQHGTVRAWYGTDSQRNAYAVYTVRYGIETVTFY